MNERSCNSALATGLSLHDFSIGYQTKMLFWFNSGNAQTPLIQNPILLSRNHTQLCGMLRSGKIQDVKVTTDGTLAFFRSYRDAMPMEGEGNQFSDFMMQELKDGTARQLDQKFRPPFLSQKIKALPFKTTQIFVAPENSDQICLSK
ncbi:MAG: hypothetical protein ABJM43_15040 [Paracoccaceae bacterium]